MEILVLTMKKMTRTICRFNDMKQNRKDKRGILWVLEDALISYMFGCLLVIVAAGGIEASVIFMTFLGQGFGMYWLVARCIPIFRGLLIGIGLLAGTLFGALVLLGIISRVTDK